MESLFDLDPRISLCSSEDDIANLFLLWIAASDEVLLAMTEAERSLDWEARCVYEVRENLNRLSPAGAPRSVKIDVFFPTGVISGVSPAWAREPRPRQDTDNNKA